MKVTDLSVPKPTLICTFRYAERKELTTQKKLKYSFVCLANKMPCFLSFLSSTFFAFLPFLPIWNAKQFCGWLGHLLSAFVDSQLSSNSNGAPTLKAWSDQHPAYTLSPPTLIHFNVDSHRRARPRLAGSVHIQTQRAACRPCKANRRAPSACCCCLQRVFITQLYNTLLFHRSKKGGKLWSLYRWDTPNFNPTWHGTLLTSRVIRSFAKRLLSGVLIRTSFIPEEITFWDIN